MFRKKSVVEVKQPQEYFCSNVDCFNEIAKFSPLFDLLTEEAQGKDAENYCFSCIVEGMSQ
jgi:hypothetical protein